MKKVLIVLPLLLIGAVIIMADDDEHGHYGFKKFGDVAVANNAVYQKECGSCHFAYQPGLLPKRSWIKMMGTLDNHFGDDASLDPKTTNYLKNYLVNNSSDNSLEYKRSKKITASISSNQIPLRITKTPYFVHEHSEIPKRLVTQKDVGTFSNCIACHTTADKGNYSERSIKIPNHGRWDD